jgi:hypothetical protein
MIGQAGATILGIETSCDETAAAVVTRSATGKGKILANVVRSQIDEHKAYGGVVPELAARSHVAHLDHIVKAAMQEAGLSFADLDGVAATAGPGLIGGVLVAFLEREDVRDAFVSLSATTIDDLPQGARLGTSSIRRAAQMRRHRPDLQIVPFRGNVESILSSMPPVAEWP